MSRWRKARPGPGFWSDDSGASATEYALTLAIIGGCVACTAIGLGYAIAGAFNHTTQCIDSHNGSCAPEIAAAEPEPHAPDAAGAADPAPGGADPAPGGADPAPGGQPAPTSDPAPAADPGPADGESGKGKPPKPPKAGKGCPPWAPCKR